MPLPHYGRNWSSKQTYETIYVKSNLLKKYKENNIYTVGVFSDKYSTINIHIINFDRLSKISTLKNKKNKIVDIIDFYINHRIDNIMEQILIDELAESIDKQIIDELLKLKQT